jgi:hypothetical protein
MKSSGQSLTLTAIEKEPSPPPTHLRAKLGRLFLPFPLSRYRIVSCEAAG